MKKKLKRIIQFITFVHEIHHIKYSYGWWSPLFPFIGYFPEYFNRRKTDDHYRYIHKYVKPMKRFYRIKLDHFHNCTWTGVY